MTWFWGGEVGRRTKVTNVGRKRKGFRAVDFHTRVFGEKITPGVAPNVGWPFATIRIRRVAQESSVAKISENQSFAVIGPYYM